MGRTDNGRPDRRHITAQRRADVVTKVRDLEAKRDGGLAAIAGKVPTVGQWLEHWVTTIDVRRVRPWTLRWYETVVRHHLIPPLGHHRHDRLQPENVEASYARLEASGMAPATALQVHRVLSRALKVGVQRGRLARNVCSLVDAPAVTRAEVQPLTADEARAVLPAASERRNAARWSAAVALGLRQGESLGLRWQDLDLDVGALSVRQALQRQRGAGLVFVPPKSAAGQRTIALPEPVVSALREHRRAQLQERLAAGSEWRDPDLVFAQVNGSPIDPSADHREWKALLRAAGVRTVRLHDARHTAATLQFDAGGAPARRDGDPRSQPDRAHPRHLFPRRD
jgi:integrase